MAQGYDRLHRDGPNARNPVFLVPRTVEDLRERCDLLVDHDVTLSLSAVAMALLSAAPNLSETDDSAGEKIHAWFDDCSARDVRFAELITDAKGDRTLSPSKQDDPDLYVRVVDRDRNGVVIRGAKFHITAGPIVHELVVLPTKRMRAGEEDYAIACAVPADADGVTQIASSHHPDMGTRATSRSPTLWLCRIRWWSSMTSTSRTSGCSWMATSPTPRSSLTRWGCGSA